MHGKFDTPIGPAASTPSSPELITSVLKPAKKDKFNRRAWADDVHADHKTPDNAKCLAFGIAKFVNKETGEARPSTLTLAKVCGKSETWVRKMIPVLQATGWIDVAYGSKGRGEAHCNVYRINPEKRTPCAVLAAPENRTREIIKPHPVCEEPRISKKDSETKIVETSSLLTPIESPEASLDRGESGAARVTRASNGSNRTESSITTKPRLHHRPRRLRSVPNLSTEMRALRRIDRD
jgi:hypothetical protein